MLRYLVAQDAGRAVHPSYVEGQFQGGAVQGIGWALNEEYVYGKMDAYRMPPFLTTEYLLLVIYLILIQLSLKSPIPIIHSAYVV